MLPLFVVTLPLIILFCGLSIDVGLLELKSVQMQTAADAAALGAELEWERNGNQAVQGKADAAANGFTDGVNNVTVNVNTPATSGDYINRYDVMQVTISQTVTTIFMGTLNGGKATVSVSAAARMPPCGYYTNTAGISNNYTLNITNSMSVGAQGVFSRCPVYIKSNLYLDATMGLDEYAINATGAVGQSTISGSHWPNPTYGALNVADPLASLTQPTASACSHTNFSVTTGSVSLNPGTYCGSSGTPGIKLSGGGNMWFNPGLYVITGGFKASNVNLAGSGVTFFFTKVNGTSNYGQVIFSSVPNIDLNAPTVSSNGALATILFFTDRNWIHTSAQDFQFNDAEYYGDGIWYVTGTGIQLTAKSSTWSSDYIALITDSVYVDSSTLNLFSDFSGINTGNPFRTDAVLVQ